MTRDEFLTAVAELHTKWALKHGDDVPYVVADENPHPGQQTDLAIWQADRSAPAEIDDPLNAALLDLLEQYRGTTVAATAAPHRGGVVALVPTAKHADRLAFPGGEPADQLHTTVVYLDETTTPETWATVVELCETLATQLGSVEADGFAVSVFNPDTDDACVVLGLGGDALAETHDQVVSWLHMAGVDMSGQHEPWIPHLTLAYTQAGAELVELVVDRVGPVIFDRLRVAFGPDVLDYPLTAAERVLVAHLPGKHDQRDHGRRGGGRSAGRSASPVVRRTFSEAAAHRAYDYDDPATGISARVTQFYPPTSFNDNTGYVSVEFRNATGDRVGHASRQIRPSNPDRQGKYTVNHHNFELKPGVQGAGFATRWNAHAEAEYRARGVQEITLHANISIGGYAWARAGYDFDRVASPSGPAVIHQRFRNRITPRTPARIRRQIDDLQARMDTATPAEWAMVGWRPGATTWFGKTAMLGSNWDGVKRLT